MQMNYAGNEMNCLKKKKNRRASILPWYGCPYSRPASEFKEIICVFGSIFDKLGARKPYSRMAYAHGSGLRVHSPNGVQEVPTGLANRLTYLYVMDDYCNTAMDCNLLVRFHNLKDFSLGAFVKPINLSGLGNLRNLIVLSIEAKFNEILDLNMFDNLQELSLHGGVKILFPQGGHKTLGAICLRGEIGVQIPIGKSWMQRPIWSVWNWLD